MQRLVVTCVCGERIQVPRSAIGRTGLCPACERPITIRSQNAAPTRTQPAPRAVEASANMPVPASPAMPGPLSANRVMMAADDSKRRFSQAVDLYFNGRYAESLTLFDALIQEFPDLEEIQTGRALCIGALRKAPTLALEHQPNDGRPQSPIRPLAGRTAPQPAHQPAPQAPPIPMPPPAYATYAPPPQYVPQQPVYAPPVHVPSQPAQPSPPPAYAPYPPMPPQSYSTVPVYAPQPQPVYAQPPAYAPQPQAYVNPQPLHAPPVAPAPSAPATPPASTQHDMLTPQAPPQVHAMPPPPPVQETSVPSAQQEVQVRPVQQPAPPTAPPESSAPSTQTVEQPAPSASVVQAPPVVETPPPALREKLPLPDTLDEETFKRVLLDKMINGESDDIQLRATELAAKVFGYLDNELNEELAAMQRELDSSEVTDYEFRLPEIKPRPSVHAKGAKQTTAAKSGEEMAAAASDEKLRIEEAAQEAPAGSQDATDMAVEPDAGVSLAIPGE